MHGMSLAGTVRRALFVAVAAALASGTAPATPHSPADSPVLLKLQHDAFDPLQRDADVPAALGWNAKALEQPLHVVQFHGPIDQAARNVLRDAGAEVLGYVPDFALLVRSDPSRLQALSTDSRVRWTGPWLPAFRLHPQLHTRAIDADATQRQVVEVILFPDASTAALRQALAVHSIQVPDLGKGSPAGATLRIDVPDAALAELAQRPEVAWIEPHRPVLRANAIARGVAGKDHIESVLGLYGDGQMVGVGDDGLSTGNEATLHPDFDGRLAGATSSGGGAWGFDSLSHHGTHVAGTVLGSGLLDGSDPAQHQYAGSNAGVAPEALLYAWALCPCDWFLLIPGDLYAGYLQPQYAFDPRLRVSNNSWGNSFNGYSSSEFAIDAFVRDHQDMVVVAAAGNDGPGANTVGSPSTAKNSITVGSVDSNTATHPAYVVSDFSSRGPVQDGRLKPDVVAPGNYLESTTTTAGAHGYSAMAGTSMAAPVVSGAAAIVRQFYQELQDVATPSAALVKATLINSAMDVGGGSIRLPDMAQGWGRIDLRHALLHENGRSLWYYEHPGLATGESFSATLALHDTGFPIQATLVWSDAEALAAATPNLVNDLDLVLSGPGADADHTGNDRLGDALLDLDVDRLNNVEGADVEAPVAGEWTLTVSGYNVPDGPQPFALVASGGFRPWSALTLDVSPDSASICAGASAQDLFALDVRRHRSDLSAAVTLAIAGLPAAIDASFAANDLPADFGSTLSLALPRSIPAASYALTVQADAGAVGTLVGATLTVLPLPASPALQQPVAGADDVPRLPVLDWQAAADTDGGYRVEIAADAEFTSVLHAQTVAVPGLAAPDSLDLATTYYWRVTALNDCGETTSAVRSFTVVGEPIFADAFEGEAPG